jgi:hypothetical protein
MELKPKNTAITDNNVEYFIICFLLIYCFLNINHWENKTRDNFICPARFYKKEPYKTALVQAEYIPEDISVC